MIGLVFAVVFVATAGAVLMLMAEIARDTPQGGTTAVRIPAYAGVAPAIPPPATRPPTPRQRGTGRHRK